MPNPSLIAAEMSDEELERMVPEPKGSIEDILRRDRETPQMVTDVHSFKEQEAEENWGKQELLCEKPKGGYPCDLALINQELVRRGFSSGAYKQFGMGRSALLEAGIAAGKAMAKRDLEALVERAVTESGRNVQASEAIADAVEDYLTPEEGDEPEQELGGEGG